MSAESGRKLNIGIGLEATRGTSVAPAFWTQRLESDFLEKVEKKLNESGLGVLDKNNAADVFKKFAGGKISGKVQDQEIGALLALAFGQKPTTSDNADSDASVKDHTFAQSHSNTPLSATIAIKDGNRDERYPLASLAQLDLTLEKGDWLKFSADFISKKPTSAAGNTVAYTEQNEFKAKHATVKLAASEAGLASADAIPLSALKLSVMRTLNDYLAIGSDDLHDIFTEEVDFKGDFTMLFDSVDHRDSYLDNDNQWMELTFENTDVTIGAAAHPKLVITLSKVNFAEWNLDQGLSTMVPQTIGFTPLYNLSEGNTWGAVLTNTKASY